MFDMRRRCLSQTIENAFSSAESRRTDSACFYNSLNSGIVLTTQFLHSGQFTSGDEELSSWIPPDSAIGVTSGGQMKAHRKHIKIDSLI